MRVGNRPVWNGGHHGHGCNTEEQPEFHKPPETTLPDTEAIAGLSDEAFWIGNQLLAVYVSITGDSIGK
jgi:hypothetical protein